jgi:hypothetical protein
VLRDDAIFSTSWQNDDWKLGYAAVTEILRGPQKQKKNTLATVTRAQEESEEHSYALLRHNDGATTCIVQVLAVIRAQVNGWVQRHLRVKIIVSVPGARSVALSTHRQNTHTKANQVIRLHAAIRQAHRVSKVHQLRIAG